MSILLFALVLLSKVTGQGLGGNATGNVVNPYSLLNEGLYGQVQYKHKWFTDSPENLLIAIPKYVANRRQKPHPLVLFFSGFGSNIPVELYHDVLSQMASKGNGAVVVAWDGLGVANPLDMKHLVVRTESILEYLQRRLRLQIYLDFLDPVDVDVSQVFFAGHSSGCQIAALMAERHPEAQGLILLDPVDSDPLHLTIPAISGQMNYTGPVLVVDSFKCLQGNPPCCPPFYSGQHFYDGYPRNFRVKLTALDYGHADLLGPDNIAWAASRSHFCGTVDDPNKTPFYLYRNLVSGAAAAFIAAFSGLRDARFKPFLTLVELFNIDRVAVVSSLDVKVF